MAPENSRAWGLAQKGRASSREPASSQALCFRSWTWVSASGANALEEVLVTQGGVEGTHLFLTS